METTPTLVVLLHGWLSRKIALAGVKDVVRRAYGADVTFCEPGLGYEWALSARRATTIVGDVLVAIDAACAGKSFVRIVFVGHSVGATLLRRVYLVAAGAPGNFVTEPELAAQAQRPWADRVERLVLLAAFNRGWSVSERTSWYYAIAFNIVGALGHLSKKGWVPGIFDFRLGAPFMVQTRLHWMAHRRRGDRPTQPFVVQIIGTQDDLVAPFDQVDISVDNAAPRMVERSGQKVEAAAVTSPAQRNYFLLEMAHTNHRTILDVHAAVRRRPRLYGIARFFRRRAVIARAAGLRSMGFAARRRRILRSALVGDRSSIGLRALDPTYLCDQAPIVDTTVKNVVFVIHGIRDDGFWTHRIAERVRQRAASTQPVAFRSWTPTYGYFAMLPFLLPWIRRQKVEWFMDQYVSAFAQYPNADFHYVGHSNGTYLAAAAFELYPAFHLRNVLFAGSVVRTTFGWRALFDANRVRHVQNIVASADWVVAAFPKSVEGDPLFDLGGAGVDGFRDASPAPSTSDELRYVRGAHGEGIREEHWNQIAAFIVDGTPMTKTGPANLYASEPGRLVSFLGWSRCAIPLILIFAIAIGVLLAGLAELCLPSWAVSIVVVAYLALLRFVVIRV